MPYELHHWPTIQGRDVLARNPGGTTCLVGARLSYADLSLFRLVAGLLYAFPRATGRSLQQAPLVAGWPDRVAQHRRSPELDG